MVVLHHSSSKGFAMRRKAVAAGGLLLALVLSLCGCTSTRGTHDDSFCHNEALASLGPPAGAPKAIDAVPATAAAAIPRPAQQPSEAAQSVLTAASPVPPLPANLFAQQSLPQPPPLLTEEPEAPSSETVHSLAALPPSLVDLQSPLAPPLTPALEQPQAPPGLDTAGKPTPETPVQPAAATLRLTTTPLPTAEPDQTRTATLPLKMAPVTPATPAPAAAVTPAAAPSTLPSLHIQVPAEKTAPQPITRMSSQPLREEPETPGHPADQHSAAPGQPAGDLANLYRLAQASSAARSNYIVRLRRRETVRGKPQPEECILFKFRQEPFSVYFKWLGGAGQGREAVYVRDQHENKIHALIAAGDVPWMPAGKRFALAPDSPLLKARCRYPITAASFGAAVQRFGALVEASTRNAQGQGPLQYLGLLRRPEFPEPVEVVRQIIPPGGEPGFPQGGYRYWYFDTHLRLPILILSQDPQQREVDYLCFEHFFFPGSFPADEFNPERIWGQPDERSSHRTSADAADLGTGSARRY